MAANLSYVVQRGEKEGQFFLFDDVRGLTSVCGRGEESIGNIELARIGIKGQYAGHSF